MAAIFLDTSTLVGNDLLLDFVQMAQLMVALLGPPWWRRGGRRGGVGLTDCPACATWMCPLWDASRLAAHVVSTRRRVPGMQAREEFPGQSQVRLLRGACR